MPPQQNTPVTPPPRNQSTSPRFDPSLYTEATLPLAGQKPPKKSKKRLIFAIIVVLILTLLGAGVALGYSLYQSPDKVVADAFGKVLESKSIAIVADFKALEKSSDGTEKEVLARLNAAAEDTKASGTLDVTVDGISYGGAFISTGTQESFLKVTNLGALLTNVFGEETSAQFKPFITTVNEKWIRLDNSSANDALTKEYSQQQTCYDNALAAYSKSKVQRQQLIDAYKKNPLFKAKHTGEQTIHGVESLRIELTPNTTKYASFVTEIKRADVVIALDKCSKGELVKNLDESAKSQSQTSDKTETKIEIWASKWEHVLTQAKQTTKEGDSTSTLQVNPTFNKPVMVERPTESISLQQAVESFMKALLGATVNGSGAGAGSGLQLN